MLEIFKGKKVLPRTLVEKMICFDRVKEYCNENQISGMSNFMVKSLIQKTHQALDNIKPRAQIKISQQATETNEDQTRINTFPESSLLNIETIDDMNVS